ncbi:MAG: hypothetical protein IJM23_06785 [Lachnospiraceae bacterium]|nr:hypothetical protein [Lachnospiraceae bacterium]
MKKRFMRLMSVLTCVTMITQSSVGMIPVYAQPDDGQVQETQEVEDALSFGDEDVEASDDISVEYEEASDQDEVLSSGDDETAPVDEDVVAEDEETSVDGDEESSQPTPPGEGVEVVGGYIETPWDNSAQVVDDDLDYDEALEMMVDDPDDEEDSLGEDVPDPVKYVEEPSTIESKYPVGTDSEALAYLKNTFPANRSQSPYGSCWAHAAISLTEFYMVKHGLKDKQGTVDKSVNYSELQLAYFCYNKAPDPVNGSTGDKITYYNDKGSKDSFLNFGGSIGYAAQSLMRYNGITDDAGAAAYSNASSVLSNGLADEYARSKDVAHLKNVYLLSIAENPKLVKQAIKENGIVGVSMYADRNYLNSSTNSYYCTEAKANHAVAIVGWNDDYPASNFKTDPGSNGAWLVRNSWTTNVEYSYYSYFWLSYKDKSLSDTAYVFEMADNDKDEFYDNNYNYDSQLHSTSSTYGSSKSANVFTVVNPSETLKAVQFDSSMIAPGNYTVEIYKNLKHSGNPESGTKIDEATTTGTIPFSGSFTIPLKSSVDLYQGEMFSVVITAECGLDRERDHVWLEQIDMDVSINAGESFIYKNSTWNDLSNDSYGGSHGNFCIRALTNTNGGASIPDKITNLSVKSVNEQSVTLIWSASLDAEGYEVWSSESENGTYTMVGKTSASERQYKHSNLYAGTVYYYKVYPIKNGSRFDAGVSYVVSARTNAAIPKVEIVKVGKYTADIRWDALENCDGYEYKYGTGTSYYGPDTLTANEARLNHLNPGQEFWVEVRSYVEDGDNRTLSDAERVTFKTESGQGSAVTNLKAVPYSETSVKLSWDGTDEAAYYNVYKSEDGINYTNVGITTYSEKTVWDLDSSVEYYFKVAAVYYKFGYDNDSIDSEVVRSYTGLPTVVLGQPTYENGSIKVNWEAASGVKYYAVYRLEYSTAQYEPLALVEDALTYTDEDVLPGPRYSYQVHACRSNVMRDDQGLSYTASIAIPLDLVKDLTISNITQRGATLSWSAIRGAQGYLIKEYDPYAGRYSELDRIDAENTTYTLNCFMPKTSHAVFVCAYTDYYTSGTSGSNSWFTTLDPGPADVSLFTLSDKIATYDGQGHSAGIVSSDEETENKGYDVYYGKITNGRVSSYSADLPVYADDYKIKINTKDTTYYTATELTDDDWVLTVNPKTVGLNWENTEFDYDGKSHIPSVTLTGVLASDNCTVTVTGAQKDAGNYTATASSLSNTNYRLPADNMVSFTIAKADSSDQTAQGSVNYGQSGNVDLSEYIAAGGSIKANGISVTDADCILYRTPTITNNVLSFTFVNDKNKVGKSAIVTLLVDGGKNYEDYTITVTVTVLDKPEQKVTFISPTTSIVSKTYGNRDFYVSALGEGEITYSSSDTSVATVGQSDGKIHIVGAGEVTITANAAETSDYAPGSASFVLKVDKKTIGISWSDTKFTYDKTVKAPTATATGLVGEDECNLTVDGAKTNAGTYTASVTGLDNDNYELPESLTCSYEIEKRPVTISGLYADDKYYDGTKDALITGDAALEGKIEGDDLFVAPGSAYFVSADAGENIRVYFENFELGGDDKDNYMLSAQPSYVTANIRKLSMSVTAEDVEETYDGFDHGIDVLVLEPYQGYEIKYGTR